MFNPRIQINQERGAKVSIDFSFLGANVNESTGMPADLYTDPGMFEQESANIFMREWIAVARTRQIPNPGDYLTHSFFGLDIVIVRDKNNRINAFSNTCLHRAYPLANGVGHCKNVLVCPYHKWTYELDGALRGAPNMEQAKNFDKSNLRLPFLLVEEWQGWSTWISM